MSYLTSSFEGDNVLESTLMDNIYFLPSLKLYNIVGWWVGPDL